MQHWRISAQGLGFIARFEGYRGGPYNEATGNATIGYGHLIHYGPVTWRDHLRYPVGLSVKAALKLLRADAAKAEAGVNAALTVGVVQAQFDALCSFAFNCGVGALQGSTLLRDINGKAGNTAIRAAFMMWTHAGGVESPGLVRRRRAEADLFLLSSYKTP
jgi:lysozyme